MALGNISVNDQINADLAIYHYCFDQILGFLKADNASLKFEAAMTLNALIKNGSN